ncbi:hypothetical protein LCI18_001583 [Fusarium solani-melongenae]|uniref:Uncharacterized protein n=1 Tax=Fusarium solani subsp. cucurbitae TaxID=2747967 RepID=A0ACD3YS20_FUSSC|nr:hypothetical protein LCI18_001583 [Fusarium solani-melongenae]
MGAKSGSAVYIYHLVSFIYVSSSSGETVSVYNPADGSLVTDQAVDAATAAFKTWKKTPSSERAAIMLKYADLVEKNAAKLAELETLAMGVPSMLASQVVAMHYTTFRYYAGLTDKIHGETYTEDGDGMLKLIMYEPIGVCAGISAWNGTHLSFGWKIAPAVAAGNTFIHKTSEKSPLSILLLGTLIKEAGFPPGVINLLSGAGKTGSLLASHMGIDKICFTGSIEAGRKVQVAAAQSNLKHVTLELGGKSASIVFEDANLENAVLHNSQSFLANNAQACSAASRLFVHESIAPKFIESLKQSFIQLSKTIGDPTSEKTFLGPLVDGSQLKRVTEYIEGAKGEGIEVLVGGEQRSGPGQFVSPTLFLNPSLDSRIYKEEVFGPVLVVRTFKTEDEVVGLANDTPYGLSGIIFTSDITRGLRVASKLDVGTLSINSAHWTSKQTSWGGWKQSGFGREGGLEGLKEYVQSKSIHVNLKL